MIQAFASKYSDVLSLSKNWAAHKQSYINAAYSEFAKVRLIACKSICKVAHCIGKD